MFHLIKKYFKKKRQPATTCYVVTIATNTLQNDLCINLEAFPFTVNPQKHPAPNQCNKMLYREIFTDKIQAQMYKEQLQALSLQELVGYLEYRNVAWDDQS